MIYLAASIQKSSVSMVTSEKCCSVLRFIQILVIHVTIYTHTHTHTPWKEKEREDGEIKALYFNPELV